VSRLLTDEERAVFLRRLSEGQSVRESARQAGRAHTTFLAVRDRDPVFAHLWERATVRDERVEPERELTPEELSVEQGREEFRARVGTCGSRMRFGHLCTCQMHHQDTTLKDEAKEICDA
jgi:hypothetical protein